MAGTERLSDLALARPAQAGERLEGRLDLAVLAACVAALALVEVALFARGHVLAGQIADAVLLLVLLNFGGRRGAPGGPVPGRPAVRAMLALSLVPLARVAAAGLPLGPFSRALAELMIALPIGFAAIRLAPGAGVSIPRLLAVRPARSNIVAGGAGLTLGFVVYLVGAPPLLPPDAPSGRFVLALIAATAAAFAEELVFRGLVQITLQRVAGRAGVLAASTLFAFTYLGAGSASLVLAVALAGVVFAHAVARTGALAGAIAGHWALSIGGVLVWPALLGRSPPTWVDGWFTTAVLAVALAGATVAVIRRPPVDA